MLKKFSNFLYQYSIYLILLLAAGLRLYQLDRRDFWYDEAFTGVAIKETWSGMMKMILADVHPPFYYGTLKLFASYFNYSVYGIRLYSVIFGLLCIWAVYLFTKELFDKKAALLAALIATISPFAIQYSMEARMYSMLSFFLVIAAYFLIKSLKVTKSPSHQVKDSILFGLFLGLAALTHYMGVIFAPIFYLVYIVWNKSEASDLKVQVSRNTLQNLFKRVLPDKKIIIGFVVAVLVFPPWIPYFRQHIIQNATSNSLSWITPASFGDIPANVQMFIFGTPLGEMSSGMPGPNEFWGIANVTAFALVIVFLTLVIEYLVKKEDKRKIFTVILFSLGFMAEVWLMSLLGKQFFVARYLLPGGYFIFVLIGVWLARLKLPYSTIAVGAYIVLLLCIQPLGYSLGWNEFEKHLAQYKNNDFYILNSFDYVIAKYYVGADHLTLYNVDWPQYNPSYWAAIGPNLRRTENFEDLRNDPKALIISNTQLDGKDNKNFDPTGLVLVDQYKNILIYKFQ